MLSKNLELEDIINFVQEAHNQGGLSSVSEEIVGGPKGRGNNPKGFGPPMYDKKITIDGALFVDDIEIEITLSGDKRKLSKILNNTVSV